MPKSKPRQLLGQEVLAHLDEVVGAYVARIRSVPGYEEDKVPLEPLVASTAGLMSILIQNTVIDELPLGSDLLAATRRSTRERAAMGVPVESMMRALHIGADEMWRGFERGAERLNLSGDVVRDATSAMQDGIGQMMAWVASAHGEFDLERSREEHRRREQLVQDILQGTADETELSAHRLKLEDVLVPVRLRGMDAATFPGSERTLMKWAVEHGGIVATLGHDLAGFLGEKPPPKQFAEDVVIGIGPASTLRQIGPGFQIATRIVETAAAFMLTGVFDLDNLGAKLAVQSEADIGATLLARYVSPIEALGGFGRDLLLTIDNFIELGMRHEATAAKLNIHRNTLRYRLDRYAQLTGADLRRGQDLVHVWWALQRRRIK